MIQLLGSQRRIIGRCDELNSKGGRVKWIKKRRAAATVQGGGLTMG